MKKITVLLSLFLFSSSLFAQIITEIMVNPDTGGEWIEIYNNSSSTAFFDQLMLEDNTHNPIPLGAHHQFLPPRKYLLFAKDSLTVEALNPPLLALVVIKSSLPALNNDGDDLILRLTTGDTLDHVVYNDDAGKIKGRSWERIALNVAGVVADNWAPCADLSGNTAGRENSVAATGASGALRQIEITADPNPFSPDGDGRDDVTKISFHIPVDASRISVIAYDLNGRQVRLLASNIPAGSATPTLEWDGHGNSGEALPVGRYIIFIEAVDTRNGQIISGKCTVVLAQKL